MQWFRFYHEALDDPKVQRLPGDLFKAWVNILCIASQQPERGTLPTVEDIAFRLRIDYQKAEDALLGLKRAGLLEVNPETDNYVIHAWDDRQPLSDADSTATERKRRQRARNEQEQSRGKGVTRDVTRDKSVTSRIGHGDVTGDVTRLEKSRVEESRAEQSRPTPLPPAPRQPDPSPPGGGGKVRAVPKPSTLTSLQQIRFEEWYSRYPNKQHRPEAERAWRRLDPDDDLTAILVGDLQLRLAGRKWAENFIEHPATYLRNRVWEDDIEPVRAVPARASPNGQPLDPLEAQFGHTAAKGLRNLESVMRGNHAG